MELVLTRGMRIPLNPEMSADVICTRLPLLLPPAAIPGEIGRSLPPPLSLSRKVPRDGDGEDCGKLGVEVYLWLASRRKCWLAATEVFPR